MHIHHTHRTRVPCTLTGGDARRRRSVSELVVARAADDEAHGERGDGAADGGHDGDDVAPVVVGAEAERRVAIPLVAVVRAEDDHRDDETRR